MKCQEDYDTFLNQYDGLAGQGGPLMLLFILRRINNLSESVLDLLKVKVSKLDIKKIAGEDVETAISLIRAYYEVMESASTDGRDLIPPDLPKTIYKILQTTTVPSYNKIFADLASSIQNKADMGLPAEYPDVDTILTHASRAYQRFKASSKWCVPKNAQGLTANGGPPSQANFKCWNCGGPHKVPDCPKPRDDTKIEAARQTYLKNRKQRPGKGRSGKPKTRMHNGIPQVQNKNGAYVMDQKKVREQKKTEANETLIRALAASPDAVAAATAPPIVPPAVVPVIESVDPDLERRQNQIRAVLQAHLASF